MYKRIMSSDIFGLDGFIVEVEVDVSDGFPKFDIVGLPDSAIKEAAERVRAAIRNAGIAFPYQRVIVNLAPANVKKSGSIYDLAIAIGVLATQGIVKENKLSDTIIIGELTLNGNVGAVKGVLSIVDHAYKTGYKRCMVPYDNWSEAKIIEGITCVPVRCLKDAMDYLNKDQIITPSQIVREPMSKDDKQLPDFSDICGLEMGKRAAQIAVAGRHHLMLLGPPGSGKTMLAKRLPSIMPELSFEENIEITKIYSVSGLMDGSGLMNRRPFRSPHHTISGSALAGGGKIPKPGEITLAHGGILFLDEMLEFNRNVLEILRQPLEDKRITISRVGGKIAYPADFMLVGSLNPCPCGHYPDMNKCHCSPVMIQNYLNKVSGPLLDRIDIQIEVSPISYEALRNRNNDPNYLSSEMIRKKIMDVVQIQKERYMNDAIYFNAQMEGKHLKKYCQLSAKGQNILKNAFEKMGMSARGYNRVLKVSRTIADFENCELIGEEHLVEAISYRTLDKKYWEFEK